MPQSYPFISLRRTVFFVSLFLLFSMVATPPLLGAEVPAPTLLVATATGGSTIQLSWREWSGDETGFVIERATSSEAYQPIATVGANVQNYTDTGLRAGSLYLYRVRPANGTAYSNINYAVTNGAPDLSPHRPFRVKNIEGSAGADVITVSQSGTTLRVIKNGTEQTYAIDFDEIAIKGAGGNDEITVQSSVTLQARLYGGEGADQLTYSGSGKAWLVTVGGGSDEATGNGTTTSYWTDQSGVDVVNASAAEVEAHRVHRTTKFYQPWTDDPSSSNYVSKELKWQRWKDGSLYDSYTKRYADKSLWGRGPLPFDVQQGFHQNCPITSRFQSYASAQPDLLQEMAVALGDGTYAVQYGNFGADTYMRVDGDLKPNTYSFLGSSESQWWLILEKVYSFGYHRPIPGMETVINLDLQNAVADDFYNAVKQELKKGYFITFYTKDDPPLADEVLVKNHLYSILDAYRDANGTPRFVLRNPYGMYFEQACCTLIGENGLVTLPFDQVQVNFDDPAVFRVTGSVPPNTGGSPDIAGYKRLENKGYSKWLQNLSTPDGANSTSCVNAGTNVRGVNTDKTGDATRWELVPAGEDYYHLRNIARNHYLQLCYDASPVASGGESCGSTYAVRGVPANGCTGSWTQWKLVDAGEGYYRLENKGNGHWLQMTYLTDIDDGGGDGGQQVRAVSNCKTGTATQWKLVDATSNARLAATSEKDRLEAAAPEITDDWRIYPNPMPVGSDLSIRLPFVEEQTTYLSVINVTGSVIMKRNINSEGQRKQLTLDLAGLSPGLYAVRAESAQGVLVEKLLIE